MCNQFVDDCVYVLVQPEAGIHFISGWLDRQSFLARKVDNPVTWTSGQTECWGVLWSNLLPLEQMPEPSQINFAVLQERVDQSPKLGLDMWYGFSASDGWVAINWLDRRNRPGKSPRHLYMLRSLDDAEIRVCFNEWSPPRYREAAQYLASKSETERNCLAHELTALQIRIAGASQTR